MGTKRKFYWALTLALVMGFAKSATAEGFSFTFEWGNIPLCNTGYPNVVPNPVFSLSNVPQGTKTIEFTLTDKDAPSYDHGGGSVAYTGKNTLQPGAFEYESPCPPGGKHTYEWSAAAEDANGKTLGKAKAKKKYP